MDTGMRERLMTIYDLLYAAFGPQHWWPGDSELEIVLGAVLTQNVAWSNVEKALFALKSRGLLSIPALAARLQALVKMVQDAFGGDLDRFLAQDTAVLRCTLLGLKGIGPETADSIILYAARRPLFVVDAYTRRIFSRLGLVEPHADYHHVQELFMANLPADEPLFNEYHALIVCLGKAVCLARNPRCACCPLVNLCVQGREGRLEGGASPDGRNPATKHASRRNRR
ncbi:MAG: endonuclease III domain-containing protein [Syntrophomonadaceae bacterium]|nr:endonuclease III domain-containing protein [Syntrophomonadaceae bacterium]